jgi:hypothetical protein
MWNFDYKSKIGLQGIDKTKFGPSKELEDQALRWGIW